MDSYTAGNLSEWRRKGEMRIYREEYSNWQKKFSLFSLIIHENVPKFHLWGRMFQRQHLNWICALLSMWRSAEIICEDWKRLESLFGVNSDGMIEICPYTTGDRRPVTWKPFGFRLRGFSDATLSFPSTTFMRFSVFRTYCRSLYVRRSSTSIDWLMFWTWGDKDTHAYTPLSIIQGNILTRSSSNIHRLARSRTSRTVCRLAEVSSMLMLLNLCLINCTSQRTQLAQLGPFALNPLCCCTPLYTPPHLQHVVTGCPEIVRMPTNVAEL